jgi:spermidine/putrescine transport system permease protein
MKMPRIGSGGPQTHKWLLTPAIVAIGLLLILPLAFITTLSLGLSSLDGSGEPGFGAWRAVLSDGFYGWFLVKTLFVAAVTTAIAALLGFPPAYLIATSRLRWKGLLLLLIILPFWVSYIIRTMSWINILGASGAINESLMALGLVSEPLPLLFNQGAVILGLVHFVLPFMILNIYVALDGLDHSLAEAARALGASPWQAFRRVVLPLSLPGLAAGSLISFLLAAGSYVTPTILGGPTDAMFSNLIYESVIIQLDWRTGAVLALILLAAFGTVTILFGRFFGLERIGRASL